MTLEGKQPLTAFATVTDRTEAAAKAVSNHNERQEEKALSLSSSSSSSETNRDRNTFPGFPSPSPSSTSAAAASTERPKKPVPRKKIPFEKGYSQQDWLRLTRSREDLTGFGGRPLGRKIKMEEVRKHKTIDDAWMILNGKVYNVTRYVKFHPGGVEYLMQGAGRDATKLFNKYHKWVNVDFMLQKCFLGPYDNS